MAEHQLFAIGVAIAVAILIARVLATRMKLPDAILLVLLGVGASFLPGMEGVHIPPDTILMIFLPPLVLHAAFFTAPRETRADAVPISTLAIGLTIATTVAVALATGLVVPDLGWPAAFALGAAVAPTDPVAASAVLQRLGAPRRITTILEGESLVNDGVALTIFALAVEAMTHPLTFAGGVVRLAEVVLGGIVYGLVVGWVLARVRGRLRDPGLQILLSLMTPYIAYIPAERLDVSGVLATVVAGYYLGTRGEGLLQPASRLTGRVFWGVLVFLLESVLFVLLGLQVHVVLEDVADQSAVRLALAALAVIATAIAIRMLWSLFVFPLVRWRNTFAPLSLRERTVIGWSGMRGAITLAIALSLPLTVAGRPFGERNVLIFLAAAVVLATLIGQATTLPSLLRRLGLAESEQTVVEEAEARRAAMEAALATLDRMASDDKVDEHTADVLRQLYELRLDRVRAILDEESDDEPVGTSGIRRILIGAQRAKLRQLYARGKIGAATLRKLEHELDLEVPKGLPSP